MKILDNKEDIKTCVERFEAMISSDIFTSDIFEVLDNVLYAYSMYCIEENMDTDIVLNNLSCLKSLRDLFIEKGTNEK